MDSKLLIKKNSYLLKLNILEENKKYCFLKIFSISSLIIIFIYVMIFNKFKLIVFAL